ncbi:MAG: DUF1080 domain-containing protein, partial [Bryobacteraceae bacterium]
MNKLIVLALVGLTPLAAVDSGWTALFNGRDLTGWKASENAGTFSVRDGAIVSHGARSHCFYVGPFHDHNFRNFELQVDIRTLAGSNGGVFIDTAYQESGWPGKGFEVQVNNTYKGDHRRTGSLYEVKDNSSEVAKDNEWFTEDTSRGTSWLRARQLSNTRDLRSLIALAILACALPISVQADLNENTILQTGSALNLGIHGQKL